ncbi:hypothetical protein D3C73_1600400 [compost metagenome]
MLVDHSVLILRDPEGRVLVGNAGEYFFGEGVRVVDQVGREGRDTPGECPLLIS